MSVYVLEQSNPSPTVNGAWHEQVKFPLNKFSLIHCALGSHGKDKHGSGTVTWMIVLVYSIKINFDGRWSPTTWSHVNAFYVHGYMTLQSSELSTSIVPRMLLALILHNRKCFLVVPEQLKPVPSMNGGWQVQVKLLESNPSLSQMALISQGSFRQGSGTVRVLAIEITSNNNAWTATYLNNWSHLPLWTGPGMNKWNFHSAILLFHRVRWCRRE